MFGIRTTEEWLKWRSQIPMNEDDYAVAEASNRLGINLYHLLAEENANFVFSPFDISRALAMLFCGARNETAEEIREVLGHEDENVFEEFERIFKKLLDGLDYNQEHHTLKHAVAVLSNKAVPLKKEYISTAEYSFKAHLHEVDFVNEGPDAVQWVNETVKFKTGDMIPKLVDSLDPSTALIILNAAYFKGYWLHPFEKRFTMSVNFYNKGYRTNAKKVEMMHNFFQTVFYAKLESYQALELPYKEADMSMLILLPNSDNGLSELEKSLSFTFIQDLKLRMSKRPVLVALPKFRLEYSTSLVKKLQNFGMIRVFNRGAQLDGIGDSNELFLSELSHTAIIEVNEECAEPEANSGTEFLASAELEDQPEFMANHPFMFVIHNTKKRLVLFMGRVDEL